MGLFELLAILEAELLCLEVLIMVGPMLASKHVWSLRCT